MTTVPQPRTRLPMQLEKRPIADLCPAPYNPRIPLQPGDPGWEKLHRSLLEFDLVQPIIWNRRTGHVVGGHQRLEILRHDGHTEVDCVVVDLPLEREQALNVALNNDELGSDWDLSKLNDLLTDLRAAPGFDPTLTGFDDQQLRDLLFIPDLASPTEAIPSDDAVTFITVTLEVPREIWDTVHPALDQLLAAMPQLRLHVQFPAAMSTTRGQS
ncbi:MAG: ParB N-terminal domain-containing protein [Planctomycetaceae bacterium]